MKRIILLVIFLPTMALNLISQSKESISDSLNNNFGFIENKGQIIDQNKKTNPDVKYLYNSTNINIQLRQTGFSYDTYTLKKIHDIEKAASEKFNKLPDDEIQYNFHRIDIEFEGANSNLLIEASQPFQDVINYYTSGTSNEEIVNVKHFKKIVYKNVYPQIDVEFIVDEKVGNKNGFKYNFIVNKGGDINDIKLRFKGATTEIIENESIQINTSNGNILETIPLSYLIDNNNTIRNVKVTFYKMANGLYGVKTNEINGNTLIIDPTPDVLWATYYGGADQDVCAGKVDKADNIVLSGQTKSSTNIATNGAFQTTYTGDIDCFIAKFNTSGVRQWATYYGGSDLDQSQYIAFDSQNNIIVVGYTFSTANISTQGSQQPVYAGNLDGFIIKFTSAGVRLWGTYFGGTSQERLYAVGVDNDNNIVVFGSTFSNGLATQGAHQISYGGNEDACLIKYNPDGVLLWCTYYGGDSEDEGYRLSLDANKNIYLTGFTRSANNISTTASHQTSMGGWQDAYVAKFSATGTLIWGTYYGGHLMDEGDGISVDSAGNVVVAGYTHSTNAISTSGSHQVNPGGSQDVFVVKFNNSGNRLWATYYGGSSDDYCINLETDYTNNIYFTGYTASTNAIATGGSYQPSYGGGIYDAYMVKLDENGVRQWGTYYGGSGDDYGIFISLDNAYNIYISGYTNSISNIATPGAHQTNNNGGVYDAFVAKFSNVCSNFNPVVSVNNPLCEGDSIKFWASAGFTYSWAGPNGFTSNNQSPVIPYATQINAGNYTVTISDSNGCSETNALLVNINPMPAVSFSANVLNGCAPLNVSFNDFSTPAITFWLWNFGDPTSGSSNTSNLQNPLHNFAYGGTYSVTLTVTATGGCQQTFTFNNLINVYPSPTVDAGLDQTIYPGDTITLNGSGGPPYLWTPAETLSDSDTANPLAFPSFTTTYILSVTNSFNCAASDEVVITIGEIDAEIFVPNIFSPNNDGVNDVLYVFGPNIKAMTFFIYNRWGNKVFETQKQNIGWNGFHNGLEAQIGVYVYYLEAELINEKKIIKKGNISLVR